jgi:hypothetical protein
MKGQLRSPSLGLLPGLGCGLPELGSEFDSSTSGIRSQSLLHDRPGGGSSMKGSFRWLLCRPLVITNFPVLFLPQHDAQCLL